ncbi:F-box/WD repeat-containing protein 9 [Paragonimus kellicotti]|nr:F-box/WD repeat-containing protein 9 [Paragonimus kellicotti]
MVTIDCLPFEIFRLICLFLNAFDLLSLKQVCQKFNKLLGSNFWRRRLLGFSSGDYPCLPNKKVNWVDVSIERDRHLILFGPNSTCSRFVRPEATSFGIDAMHIPPIAPELLILGDRGRVVSIFSLKSVSNSETWTPLSTDARFHSGWIWSIKSLGNSVITGSWDGNLRHWTLSNTSISPQSVYKLGAHVLCSTFLDWNTVAASSNSFVHIIDLRVSGCGQSVARLHHRKAVLCMDSRVTQASNNKSTLWSGLEFTTSASGDHISSCPQSTSDLSSIGGSDENLSTILCLAGAESLLTSGPDGPSARGESVENVHNAAFLGESFKSECSPSVISVGMTLFTGSNDRTLAGWDLRNPSIPAKTYEFNNYPRKMSLLDNDELWVAEPPNLVHVFDLRDGRLDRVYTTDLPDWTRGFGDLVATPGCIFVSGLHGTVEAFHPTNPLVPMGPKPLAERLSQNPTAMAVSQGLLAVGSGDGTVYIWTSDEYVNDISC